MSSKSQREKMLKINYLIVNVPLNLNFITIKNTSIKTPDL